MEDSEVMWSGDNLNVFCLLAEQFVGKATNTQHLSEKYNFRVSCFARQYRSTS